MTGGRREEGRSVCAPAHLRQAANRRLPTLCLHPAGPSVVFRTALLSLLESVKENSFWLWVNLNVPATCRS